MPTWGWVLLAAAAVVAVVAVAGTQVALRRRRSRTRLLRQRFGPEYDRTVREHESREDAEHDLAARLERREELDVEPLGDGDRERYLALWNDARAAFVDAPEAAAASADGLVTAILRSRGFTIDRFEQRAADVSVDHPDAVDDYRAAHETVERAVSGAATTEELRVAMERYGTLLELLLEPARTAV